MTENLGRGPFLDQNFDFEVGTTGDIRATNDGSEELEKDLAFQLTIAIERRIGAVATRNAKQRIKNVSIDVAISDSRVQTVFENSVTISETPSGEPGAARYKIVLPIRAVGEDDVQELVFEV